MSELVLVTLPIGNVEDITKRAMSALESETFFLAEDTRNLAKLLNHCGIDSKSKKIDSFHDHSIDKISSVISKIKKGQRICLVSDAGSPIISDPAYPLVDACLSEGIKVNSLSGISAVTCALELSGLPPHPFHFHGFIARDKGPKKQALESLLSISGTHIFFDSPHRVEDSLRILSEIAPEIEVAVARELTKLYETVYRFKASDYKSADINFKGEFVFLFHIDKSSVKENKLSSKCQELALNYLNKKQSPKNLSKLLAEILDEKASDIYEKLGRK